MIKILINLHKKYPFSIKQRCFIGKVLVQGLLADNHQNEVENSP